MAERRATLLLLALALGCRPVATITRPEGDGGWSAARRREEVTSRTAADVTAEGAAAAGASASAPLTLEAVLELAHARSRRIAGAERQLAIAAERVWDARGRLLPAVTGSGRYTWYTDAQTTAVNLPPGALAPGVTAPDVTIREAQFGVVNGTLTLPLDVWGELRHVLTAAQAGYRGEQARLWATTLDEEALVVRTYFEMLAAERLREVTQQTLALQRGQLDTADSRFRSGRLTKNELLVVQVALRNTEQELVRRELAIDRARWTLNETIGLAVDAPSAVADVGDRPVVPAADDALARAREHNPVLVSLLEEQQRLDDAASALARSRFPRFAAGGAVDYSSAEVVQPQRVGSGFVGFSWDLGTDTRREAEIAQARLAADANRLAVERELRGLETSVRATQRAVEERLSALAAAEGGVAQAEENLRIRQQQFDVGRATSDDVLDAEALLASQRATRATALYEAHIRRAELQQLMGLPLAALAAPER